MSSGRLDGFRPAAVDRLAQTMGGLSARADEALDWLSFTGDAALGAAERSLESRDGVAARFYQSTNAPAAAMVGVLIVAAVIFLMPTILGRIQQATPNVSGPLGDINNGEQAASIVQFSWLVPLLIVVFVVISYLRAAQ